MTINYNDSLITEGLKVKYKNYTFGKFLGEISIDDKEEEKVLSEKELFEEVINNIKTANT